MYLCLLSFSPSGASFTDRPSIARSLPIPLDIISTINQRAELGICQSPLILPVFNCRMGFFWIMIDFMVRVSGVLFILCGFF